MKRGDRFENPITGEYGYVRLSSRETLGDLLVADLRVRAGGRVAGEHIHATITERFTVLSGQIGYTLGGQTGIAQAGDTLDLPPGIAHNWWNIGTQEARVIVQVSPADRFVAMASTLFGLAKEGKTNAQGMPNLLQLAVIAAEFDDVVQFTKPPLWLQSLLFGALSTVGKRLGYQASYLHHQKAGETCEVEPLPVGVRISLLGSGLVTEAY